ncbi:hypothetical protein HZS55_06145 [Halosimplex rubrum]|uniref:Type II toxin-antitoxin system PemK/MazF family toxin n=1 Tax=Halosimplex rubrum TaxID=869889 RepID=A0A7D5P329_9EURY|nr:type II toxin-antitoxin system PemK/MazF family toxin [Halosimplex rubrum]QLH76904.1 hypothetical protein HZS55_06145 [Halosimplex rubrum]
MSEHLRCEVVTHPAIFQSYNRPYVIVSQSANPDYPDQQIALGISTTNAQDSIPISADDWEVGQLSKQSYIVPRYPTVLSATNINHTVGALSQQVVDEAVEALSETIGYS